MFFAERQMRQEDVKVSSTVAPSIDDSVYDDCRLFSRLDVSPTAASPAADGKKIGRENIIFP
jgi:hypothetical protein